MVTSKHCLSRMNQRGLTKKLINLVLEFGKNRGDKIILDKKLAQTILDDLDKKRKELLKVLDKGGVTVVVENETLITSYNTNSYKKY